MWSSRFIPYSLQFKKPATTSRGALHEKKVYFLQLQNALHPGIAGWGEAGTLPGLSVDDAQAEVFVQRIKQLPEQLISLPDNPAHLPFEQLIAELDLQYFPSLSFALETALLDWKNGGRKIIYDSSFSKGEGAVPINGLVWMDSVEAMLQQAREKIAAGFTCIKIKIGALDFDAECRLLESLRKLYNPFRLELRVDANGAFTADTATEKLRELARFELHSIEQPIRQGQWDAMEELCAKSKVPVALDEELIGISLPDAGLMMKKVRPQFIVLKPSLLGGFTRSIQWIELARQQGAGYWITSALEGNIGLNAIAQFASTTGVSIPQGLGTGQLFTNNIASPLEVATGELRIHPDKHWDLSLIDQANILRP